MKTAVLFSGGKDSNYALYNSIREGLDVVCLISMISKNANSYMFQTPGINFVKLQAESMNIPIIEYITNGEKEVELNDLRDAIILAKEKYGIEMVVTGAIKSVYQSSRIQKICNDLNLWCFNPLWQVDEVKFLRELVKNKFEIIIIGIASYPFDEKLLGRIIDERLIKELIDMQKKYKISPAGEGGEYESFVLNSPLFKKKIKIIDFEKKYKNNCGSLIIKKIKLE